MGIALCTLIYGGFSLDKAKGSVTSIIVVIGTAEATTAEYKASEINPELNKTYCTSALACPKNG
jgi:hypothetical protein